MVRALFTASLLFASAARAYDIKRDSTGAEVKWQKPVTMVADAKLENALGAAGTRNALAATVQQLGANAPGLDLTLVEGSGGKMGFDFNDASKNRNDVIALDDWPYDDDAVAVTIVTVDTRSHAILDTDIAFSGKRRWTVVGEKGEYARYDVQNTFSHELGHAVGLNHSQKSEAVMYGKTHPGETNKRRYADDDAEALATLYPARPAGMSAGDETDAPAQGCSTTPGGPSAFLFGLFALTRIRALRGAALALAFALPFSAQAQDSIAKADKQVKVAMVGKVTKATTLPPEDGATVLKTVLEVEVSECLSSACPATVKLYVPGGRWAGYEQRVGGLDTPKEGSTVGISRGEGKDPWVRIETLVDATARDAFFRQNAKIAQR